MASPTLSFGSAGRVTRMWTVGGIVGCLLLAVVAWLVLVSPAVSHISSLKSQKTDTELQNTQLQAKIAQLQKQESGKAALQQGLLAARSGLPITSGLPDLTRQLQGQAASAHVSLNSVSAGSPEAPGAIAGATTPIAGSAAGQTLAIPMTIVTAGNLTNQRQFLSDLQVAGPRLALVATVSLSPGSSATTSSIDRSVTMSVQLQVFVTPESPAAAAALKAQLATANGN